MVIASDSEAISVLAGLLCHPASCMTMDSFYLMRWY
jgi:hypothetical protein